MSNAFNRFDLVPIPAKSKKPNTNSWTEKRFPTAGIQNHVANGGNVGAKLGASDSPFIDVDLDCNEAVLIAQTYRLEGGKAYGRQSKPISHVFFQVNEPMKTQRFQFDEEVLAEVRGNGAQSLIPPSTHPSGEKLNWIDNVSAAWSVVKAEDVLTYGGEVAAAVLLTRRWQEGSRHSLSLGLAGLLAKAGWPEDKTTTFIGAIAKAADDDELSQRLNNVSTTYERQDSGEQVTGYSTLETLLPAAELAKILEWLGIERPFIGHNGGPPLNDNEPDFDIRHWNEMDLANTFVAHKRQTLAFVPGLGGWLTWQSPTWKAQNGGLEVERQVSGFLQDLTNGVANSDLIYEPKVATACRGIRSQKTARNVASLARPKLGVASER